MSRNCSPASALLCALLIVLSALSLFGQATSGAIEGTVNDDSGRAVSGAEITVESTDKTVGFKKTATANEKGNFVLAEVPVGSYTVTIRTANLPAHSSTVWVVAGQSARLLPVLGTAATSVNTGVTASRHIWEELPSATTFGSVLKFTPSVRLEPLTGGLQINGSSGSENTYFVDGQEVTNFRTGSLNANNDLPLEFLQEVQVVSTGREARFAGGTGGTVNIVTRSGGNAWRGNLGISVTPAELAGEPNVVLNRYTAAPGGFEFFQPRKDEGTAFFPTATLGGPVLKDKLWFLASYSPQIFHLRRTIDYFSTSNPANRTVRETIRYASDVRVEESFLRLDAQPVSNLRIFGSFLYNPIVQDGALPSSTEGLSVFPQAANGLRGAEFLAERGGRQNSSIINGQVTWNVTRDFLVNARAGRGFLNEKLNSYGIPRITRFQCSPSGSPENFSGSGCFRGFQNITNNSIRDYDASTRTTFDTDAVFPGLNALGRHNFRAGYQFNRIFSEVKDGYTETGAVVLFYGLPIEDLLGLPSTPGNFGSGYLERFGLSGEASSNNQAVFAQDSWQIFRRLTLNVGVRFEKEDVANFLPGDSKTLEFGWGDKIAPRLGFAFDIFGNGRTRAFGSYGFYYDRVKYELPRRTFGGEFRRRDYFEILPSRGVFWGNYTLTNIIGTNPDPIGGICPYGQNGNPPSSGWSVCQLDFRIPSNAPEGDIFNGGAIDPEIKAPRQTEFSFGIEHELTRGLSVAGLYVHKQIDRAVEDIAFPTPQGSEAYVIGNPGFGLACEIVSSANLPCPKAERDYDALEIRVDRRTSNYFFNANYTYSRLRGNYSGLASSDELGRVAPNVTAYFNFPSQGFDANGDPDNGRLATDRPHVFKAYGGYGFGWPGGSNRTAVSAFTTVQSGTPLTTAYSLYGISSSILYGRGDLGRTETFSETDLRVGHQYRFGNEGRFLIEPYVVVLNLFDERNELVRQTTISNTNFTSSTLAFGGCTTCSNEASVYATIFDRGGIQQFVQNYLDSRGVSSTGFRNDYNQPTLFQGPRNLRFGLRFRF